MERFESPDRPVTNASQVNVAQFDAEARHFADMTYRFRVAHFGPLFFGGNISAFRRSHLIELMRRTALVDVGFVTYHQFADGHRWKVRGASMEDGLCYVNGSFVRASEAKISIFDRGFTSC